MEIHVKRDWQNHLIPTDEYSLEKVKKIKLDDPRLIKITKPRNVGFHQKFFVLLNTIFEIQNMFDDKKAFRHWITMKAGFWTKTMTPTGNYLYMPKSISFAKMDEFEFQKLYDEVIKVALEHPKLCGGIQKADLLQEIQSKILMFA